MKQDVKKKEEEQKKDSLSKVREQFNKIKDQATHRVVTLITDSCCGCGCYDIEIKRTVPFDSPLKDGDRVTHMEDGDTMADDDDDDD